PRVQCTPKGIRWQPAKIRMPHSLVASSASAAQDGRRVVNAAKQRGHPAAMLYPGMGASGYLLVGTQHMQDFRPEPFGGISTSRILGIVRFPPARQPVNFFGLGDGGMVLPQDKHGIGVFRKFG